MHLSSGLQLNKLVKDFKYLGTWLISTMHDFKTRRAAAWSAIRRLNREKLHDSIFNFSFVTVSSGMLCLIMTIFHEFSKTLIVRVVHYCPSLVAVSAQLTRSVCQELGIIIRLSLRTTVKKQRMHSIRLLFGKR